ncbi:unnamed protein product [Effrenium voratum]|nr:unnamed protein product [Effrenium voratum]
MGCTTRAQLARRLSLLGLLLLVSLRSLLDFRPTDAPTASVANALLRRGGRRFFNKRLRDARSGEDDEDERRRKRHVSRRRGGHRVRSMRSRGGRRHY